MSSNLANVFIATNSANFPADSIPALSNRLKVLDDSKMALVLSTTLKKLTTALLFSIFLGMVGGDRFYLGQTGLGFAKLFLSWLTFGIWFIVDICLVINTTKQLNLQKINGVITTIK